MFVLDPIFMIFDAVKGQVGPLYENLDVKLTFDEQDVEGNALLKVVMRDRVKTLYEGLNDDERRPLRIRDACGLAFSRTVRSGPEIHIQGPDYEPGNKADLFVKSVQYTALMMGHYMESIQDRPTGNFCGLVGIDQFLLKSGTIITPVTAHDVRVMKFSASTAVEVAVEVKNVAD
ncbi:hypothetical protein DFJ58DRAFT_890856 [Suillus subalutaceus]|uniref:uncharacterized protein n=1 Tax=Suillus subalutaceus TaxID=48586 RepID=UPI001B872581|nr:uncharacterized protein DFJ58DRAFT_890856 [Suillus subalutaceus]KAG1815398.1 hypothetical protein DFJ58DRAFT_890856 [Suillus subalutaceus]